MSDGGPPKPPPHKSPYSKSPPPSASSRSENTNPYSASRPGPSSTPPLAPAQIQQQQPPQNQTGYYNPSPPTSPTSPTRPSPFSARSSNSQTYTRPVSESADVNTHLNAPLGSGTNVRRKKSLVRPERERIDANHRQFYYRQRAQDLNPEQIGESTTGNNPLYAVQNNSNTGLNVRPNNNVRRGKSILGREEPQRGMSKTGFGKGDSIAEAKEGSQGSSSSPPLKPRSIPAPPRSHNEPSFNDKTYQDQDYPEETSLVERWFNLPSCWLVYCYALTFWAPSSLMKIFGVKDPNAALAWREKIGLVSIILLMMLAVGFLTFGFTQAVCPRPPLRFHGGNVGPGYLIIGGEAFELDRWTHPPVPGVPNMVNATNVLYPPINAAGMDATFLFQLVNDHCYGVIQPNPNPQYEQITRPGNIAADDPTGLKVPKYFPCVIFNPNVSTKADNSITTFNNFTSCHLSSESRTGVNGFYHLSNVVKSGDVYYTWDDIAASAKMGRNLVAYGSDVLDLSMLKWLNFDLFTVPTFMQSLLQDEVLQNITGTDVSHPWMASGQKAVGDCLRDIIKVGSIDTDSIGCIASEIVLIVSLVVILGVVIVKFLLAVMFGWFLSWKLGNFSEMSYEERMRRFHEVEEWSEDINITAAAIKPQYVPGGRKKSLLPSKSRFTVHEGGRFGEQPYQRMSVYSGGGRSSPRLGPQGSSSNTASPSIRGLGGSPRDSMSRRSSISSLYSQTQTQSTCPFPLAKNVVPQPSPDWMPFNYPLMHTICLVTCYSEGVEGLRTTLDSIATTDYPNSHKLILVIADGIITGAGNDMSTPDICISMMKDFVIPPAEVQAYSYVAIADGQKRHNMAKVYAGFYKYDESTISHEKQQRVPMVTVVKCGSPAESHEKKPGNRGKRDSQIVLMGFLQKVMFDERMTELEYAFFNSIWRVAGVSPDRYEIVLMVDADTKIYPDSLSRMNSVMARDYEVMGLCGETKIGNKTDSWVSMIQVFEYYISHHQAKAFESIFGGVTCLPGCFCMYRIKAPKGPHDYWVPILANPDIVEHYSENVVDTLHKKNLLLLGEDRYLSTLMLRTFPKRKMIFVPQAVCKTVVPDTFQVLLSQRRRWINSTIHNLMELVLVRDLCGTFCFSMQFVVFMELVGTVVLPAAISFTLFLCIQAILGNPAVIPLILLAIILGLPAILIVMTSRKIVYVGWMLVYLLSLPIWNFVLPSYAYWHFDDFSWGQTRQLAGAGKEAGHGDKEGEFDSSKIVMRRWVEFEKERRVQEANQQGLPTPKFALESSVPAHTRASQYAQAQAQDRSLSRSPSDSTNGSDFVTGVTATYGYDVPRTESMPLLVLPSGQSPPDSRNVLRSDMDQFTDDIPLEGLQSTSQFQDGSSQDDRRGSRGSNYSSSIPQRGSPLASNEPQQPYTPASPKTVPYYNPPSIPSNTTSVYQPALASPAVSTFDSSPSPAYGANWANPAPHHANRAGGSTSPDPEQQGRKGKGRRMSGLSGNN